MRPDNVQKAHLDAEDEQGYGASVHDGLRQLRVVSGNVAERPGGRLLHSRVKLVQACDKRVHRARIHDGLEEGRGAGERESGTGDGRHFGEEARGH